jgi:hypothetical protein
VAGKPAQGAVAAVTAQMHMCVDQPGQQRRACAFRQLPAGRNHCRDRFDRGDPAALYKDRGAARDKPLTVEDPLGPQHEPGVHPSPT